MTPPPAATARANSTDADPAVAKIERPTQAGANAPGFGSDVIADALRSLDIPYIALTPGASYRGLHDSIVNYLGNAKPQMLLCLHEEAAVAIAHGYAKVTGKAMVTAVHSNVGLMHATMAMFNAWCDRMPVVVLGATGPVDAVKRRPWIDWIHTARDQGALVREYTKWDDQPSSPGAAREAIAGEGFILHDFDAQGCPGSGTRFESDYIGIVIGVGTAGDDEALTGLVFTHESGAVGGTEIEVTIDGFVVIDS